MPPLALRGNGLAGRDEIRGFESDHVFPRFAQPGEDRHHAMQEIKRVERVIDTAVDVADHPLETVVVIGQLRVGSAGASIDIAKNYAIEEARETISERARHARI